MPNGVIHTLRNSNAKKVNEEPFKTEEDLHGNTHRRKLWVDLRLITSSLYFLVKQSCSHFFISPAYKEKCISELLQNNKT